MARRYIKRATRRSRTTRGRRSYGRGRRTSSQRVPRPGKIGYRL